MKIAGLTVNSTSGFGSDRKDRLTVKRGGEVIAKVELRHRQPLKYVRKWPAGKHATSLRLQLTAAGVDGEAIAAIFEDPLPRRSKNPEEPKPTRPASAWFSVITPKG